MGRSLNVVSRGDAADALGLPCGNYPYCDGDQQPQDKLWCTSAQLRGYDSIQIKHPHGYPDSEILLCTGCDKSALNGACPPVELRRASWDTRPSPCACSSEGDNLNCGDVASLMKCHAPGPSTTTTGKEAESFAVPVAETTRVCGSRQCRRVDAVTRPLTETIADEKSTE